MDRWLLLAGFATAAVVPGLWGLRAAAIVGGLGALALCALLAYVMFGPEQDESTPFAAIIVFVLLQGWLGLVAVGVIAGAILRWGLRRTKRGPTRSTRAGSPSP